MNFRKREISIVTGEISNYIELVFKYLEIEYKDKEIKGTSEYYFKLILNKLADNVFTVNKLLNEIEDHPRMFGGISLILRTCLLDIIYFKYFSSLILPNIQDDEQYKLNENISALWSDHISFIIHLNRLKEELGHLDAVHKEHEINLINEYFAAHFEKEVQADWSFTLKNKKRLDLKTIFKDWKPKEPLIFNALELYHVFSKLEHNGELTDITHKLAIESFDNAMDKIYLSLEIIMQNIDVIAKSLFRNIESAMKEIEENRVSLYTAV